MKKQERRTVDDYLPKWLHSRFLNAVNYIWEVRGQPKEETLKRVDNVMNSGHFTDEEMSWIMLMLIIPKVNKMIKQTAEWKDFQEMKKESVH